MITNESLPWDSENVAIWNQFLKTQTGLRLLPKLLESAPSLLSGGPTNEILIRAGEFRGWQEVARALFALASETPLEPKQKSEYAPLTDDAAWNDGQKIQTP